MSFWRLSPARTVLGVSFGVLALVTGVFLLLIWQAYFQIIAQAEERARESAGMVAQQAELALGSSSAWLADLAERIDNDPARLVKEAPFVTRPTGAALVASTRFGAYALDGTLIASWPGLPVAPLSIAGTDLLTPSQEPHSTSMFFSEAEAAPALALAHAMERAGQPSGFLVLLVDDEVLEAFAQALDLGPQSTVSLIREDGSLLARFPSIAAPIKVNLDPFVGESGTYHSDRSPADGLARIVGYHRIESLGLIAIASVGRDEVFRDLWTSVLVVTLLMAPIAGGLMFGAILAAWLLNQSERSRATLQAAVARNETLFREIHHRVKNNLQSVGALLQLQPIDPNIKSAMRQRIAAMASVHEHIYRSNSYDQVPMQSYLHELIRGIREGQGSDITVIEEVEDISVARDTAMPLGLLVNEVITNALKHAFELGAGGEMRVILRSLGDGRTELDISDNGRGFDTKSPSRGIGRRLIEAFASQLGGEVTATSGTSGSRLVVVFRKDGD